MRQTAEKNHIIVGMKIELDENRLENMTVGQLGKI